MINEKMLELLCIYAVLKDNPFMDNTSDTYFALTTRRNKLESEFVEYIKDKVNYK